MSTFSDRVLKIVREIPAGQVMSYGEVAVLAGNPRAARVVGMIMSRNHDPEIPCHRVVRADGKIGGYNKGITRKKELLEKEGVVFTTVLVSNDKIKNT